MCLLAKCGCIDRDAFCTPPLLTKAFNPHLGGPPFCQYSSLWDERKYSFPTIFFFYSNMVFKIEKAKVKISEKTFSTLNTFAAGYYGKMRSGLLNFWHFYGSGRTHCRGKIGCVQASCGLLAGFHWPSSFHIGHTNTPSLSRRLVWDALQVHDPLKFSVPWTASRKIGIRNIDCVPSRGL